MEVQLKRIQSECDGWRTKCQEAENRVRELENLSSRMGSVRCMCSERASDGLMLLNTQLMRSQENGH